MKKEYNGLAYRQSRATYDQSSESKAPWIVSFVAEAEELIKKHPRVMKTPSPVSIIFSKNNYIYTRILT